MGFNEKTIKQSTCEHHPFDRTIDEYENQVCTICGKVMATAEELYGHDDEILFEFDEDDDLYYDYEINFIE